MAIELIENTGNLFQTQSVSSADWKLSPPRLFFYWMVESAYPLTPYLHKIEYPRYDEIPQFEDFTDWQFEANVQSQAAVPFIQVQNAQSNIGGLGLPFEDNGPFYSKELSFNIVNNGLLSEGQYLAEAKFKVTAINPISGSREIIAEKVVAIEFWVNYFTFLLQQPVTLVYQNNVIPFTVSEQNPPLIVNYNINGALPARQSLYYYALPSTMAFWTGVSSSSNLQGQHIPMHHYFSRFEIFFNAEIQLLAPGTYTYTFQISSFGVGRTIPVVLNVLPESDNEFEVSPNPVNFEVNNNIIDPPAQIINVASQNAWSIVGSVPAWLNISQFSGNGNATLLMSVIVSGLSTGTYNYDLSFESNGVTYTVPVSLQVHIFLDNPFNSGGLFFTKDIEVLRFNSQLLNTFIELTVAIEIFKPVTYEPIIYVRKYNIPLFEGSGDFHPGSIVHKLFEEIELLSEVVPDLENSYFNTQYKPAEVSIRFEEFSFSDVVIQPEFLAVGEIATFKMIKGAKPFMTQSNMALLTVAQQDMLRITPNSALAVSFVHFGTPQIVVKKNNQVIDDLIITAFPGAEESSKVLFSYFKHISGLSVGDVIEILIINDVEIRTQRYLVFNPGVESSYFIFLNEFDVPEFFEFSGERKINSTYTHTTSSKFKNMHAYSQKEETSNLQSLTINTGQLQPRDHIMIDAIIKSRRVWCSIDGAGGPYFRVDATSNKMQNEQTNHGEIDYNVEFNILESDAILYPRK